MRSLLLQTTADMFKKALIVAAMAVASYGLTAPEGLSADCATQAAGVAAELDALNSKCNTGGDDSPAPDAGTLCDCSKSQASAIASLASGACAGSSDQAILFPDGVEAAVPYVNC